MFEPVPELSPDLDWMMLSGQASHAMLAEALLQEFYPSVLRLTFAFAKDESLAREAAYEIFNRALLNVYRYRGQTSVKIWFFRQAVAVLRSRQRRKASLLEGDLSWTNRHEKAVDEQQAELWQAVDRLSGKCRLPALLQLVLDWEADDISQVLGLSETEVRTQLKTARRQILAYLEQSEFNDSELAHASIDERLKRAIAARWLVELLPEQLDSMTEALVRQSQRRGLRRRSLTSAKELLLTGIAILTMVGLIWFATIYLPDPQVEQLATEAAQATAQAALVQVTPTRVRRQRSTRTPTPAPSSTPQGVLYTVKQGDTLMSVATFLGISPVELAGLNRLNLKASLIPGEMLVIPHVIPTGPPMKATPVTPVPTAISSGPPKNAFELTELMHQAAGAWHTIWLDVETVDDGPIGYIGPPHIRRSQIWMSGDQFLAISGEKTTGPEEVYLQRDNKLYIAKPGVGLPWFVQILRSEPLQSASAKNLTEIFDTLWNQQGFSSVDGMQTNGDGMVAGRHAWIVELDSGHSGPHFRIWVDVATGLVLRSQQFGGPNGDTLMGEIIVQQISYDVNFPQTDLFDPRLPWRGGYAQDYTGKPLDPSKQQLGYSQPMDRNTLANLPTLGQLDASKARLTFRYPSDFNGSDALAQVNLYADDRYLKTIQFGNPWTLICNRSPDGDKLAYVSQPFKAAPQNARLRIFSLTQTGSEENTPLGDIYVTQVAFAPDSYHLAAFGFSDQFSIGAIYIIDTDTGKSRAILQLLDAKSLVWSPDGNYLAFIGSPVTLNQDHVMVVDVATGSIVYNQAIDLASGPSAGKMGEDWPPTQWQVEFPVEMGGLKACALPPGG